MDRTSVYCASAALVWLLMSGCCVGQCLDVGADDADQYSTLFVNASEDSGRPIPQTLFGIFFEEINHAGSGGLWAELVSNRGFEAGGPNTPSNIDPWTIIGDEKSISVFTERSSCFERNKVALRLDVLCNQSGAGVCPSTGVGIYNPGFWGMNIEKGKSYKVVLFVRSSGAVNVSVSLTGSNGVLASASIIATSAEAANWTRKEITLKATATNRNSRLQLTTLNKATLWFDQISAMPLDTYKGHGFRNDLAGMLVGLEPRFLRFPGGSFVEGEWLRNAFRWKETVGPWEERPGHFGDVWSYWTDDGLGYFEFLQLAEDLGVFPVWVFNSGISHQDQIETSRLLPFVQEALDGIEFAIGDANSTWGSVRAAMGHPKRFDLRYVAIGNEDCRKNNYRGIYLKFYNAIKNAYPGIKIISNCDGSVAQLDHPTDLYDVHIYKSASEMFSSARRFEQTPRNGPKAFVSEYAVKGKDAGAGSLLAALGEAGFLIGLEKNSDVIEMASYAPLLVNNNNKKWYPDAIIFNSWQLYGTPSYWVQRFFTKSSGSTVFNTTIQSNSSNSLAASAISWKSFKDGTDYIRIKIVNFGGSKVNLKMSVDGLDPNFVQVSGSTKTVLTSANLMDVNSFKDPKKVYPVQTPLTNADEKMDVELSPYSFTSFDLIKV